MNTISEVKKKIEEETKLIKELENSAPKFVSHQDRDKDPEIYVKYWQWNTKLKDAYWRRRNLWAKLEKLQKGK